MTGFNNAISHTLKNAVYGEYTDLRIDYRFLLVSKGMLPNVISPTAVSRGNGSIGFNWIDNSGWVSHGCWINHYWWHTVPSFRQKRILRTRKYLSFFNPQIICVVFRAVDVDMPGKRRIGRIQYIIVLIGQGY